ncbi:AAA family ATPase [Mannheimia sp. HC-2023]|uniref:AAA family ATPase n=1 Tax=Mannheimia indoligenes TaxID=3103145 RepID=UPI002FE60A00
MRFNISKIGKVRSTEIELNDLTIICGKNNTAKTYITYTLYGFMDFISNLRFEISDFFKDDLMIFETSEEAEVIISINRLKDFVKNDLVQQFSRTIPNLFSSKNKAFNNSSLSLLDDFNIKDIDFNRLAFIGDFAIEIEKRKEGEYFSISKTSLQNESLKNKDELSPDLLYFAINNEIKVIIREVILNKIPSAFISSVERSGISLFQKEITLSRSRAYDEFFYSKNSIKDLFNRVNRNKFSVYPLPIRDNLKFVQNLFFRDRELSPFIQKYDYLLHEFSDLIGGEYLIDNENEEIRFIPNNENLELSMMESSSSIRSLCDLGIYLKFFAEEGDLIIIDEPELNLHPENQRKLARLFAKLINCGLKILITTHSDYIIKELSILCILNSREEILPNVNKISNVKYELNSLLDLNRINVFLSKDTNDYVKLYACEINNIDGIVLPTFDDTIQDINSIMDEIAFSSEI